MEKPVDKRDKLDTDVFTYKITKDNKVFIVWKGKQVTTLRGGKADDFICAIHKATGKEAQLIMAKATGNFKHGNEKQGKLKW